MTVHNLTLKLDLSWHEYLCVFLFVYLTYTSEEHYNSSQCNNQLRSQIKFQFKSKTGKVILCELKRHIL
jgi:hypothetical protein